MIINRIVYNYLPLGIRAYIFKKKMMDKPCGYGEVYRVTLNKAFDTFLAPDERNNKELIEKLTDDIVKCWLKYAALPYEYFLFNFRNRSDAERWAFETDMDRIGTLRRITGEKVFFEEISDKYNFYLLSKTFFKREAIKIDSKENIKVFVEFVRKQSKVFIKPLQGSQGKGAHIYCFIDNKHSANYCLELINNGSSWMVEECIKQNAAMGQWNETSVNTARGKLINPDNLYEAMKSELLSAAALDTHYEEPIKEGYKLAKLENVILTPHIGGLSYEAFHQMMADAVNNIVKYDKGNIDTISDKLLK